MSMWFADQTPDGSIGGPTVALWTTAPSDDPDFSNEVSGNQYSRITTTSSDWTQSGAGAPTEFTSDTDFSFGQLDDSADVTVEGVVLVREDLQSDEAIFAGDDVSTTVASGNEYKIVTGEASFSLD